MDFGIGSVTAITAICYLGGMACKATTKVKDEVIPVICGVTGGILGVAGMYLMPEFPATDVIERCSYWYCIRAGSNRSAPGHQTLTPVANQVKTGWQQEDSGWRFYSKDGSGKHVTNAWYEDNGKWYWFDGAGKMVHDVWYQYKGSLVLPRLRWCHGKRLADYRWKMVLYGYRRSYGYETSSIDS